MSIVNFFKEEDDLWYIAGQKKGEANKSFEFVERLIEKAGWSDEQTADVANVSVAYVNEVRNELASRI